MALKPKSHSAVKGGRDNKTPANLVQNQLCLEFRDAIWKPTDLLHVLVEAKSSLYLWKQSSLKRDFTRLMWADRWILEGEITRLRVKHLCRLSEQNSSWLDTRLLLKLVDLLVIISQPYEEKGKLHCHLTSNKKDLLVISQQINIHTATKSVFTIMLMNFFDLLQEHLHLLTAARDKSRDFQHQEANEATVMS